MKIIVVNFGEEKRDKLKKSFTLVTYERNRFNKESISLEFKSFAEISAHDFKKADYFIVENGELAFEIKKKVFEFQNEKVTLENRCDEVIACPTGEYLSSSSINDNLHKVRGMAAFWLNFPGEDFRLVAYLINL